MVKGKWREVEGSKMKAESTGLGIRPTEDDIEVGDSIPTSQLPSLPASWLSGFPAFKPAKPVTLNPEP